MAPKLGHSNSDIEHEEPGLSAKIKIISYKLVKSEIRYVLRQLDSSSSFIQLPKPSHQLFKGMHSFSLSPH